jgi:serine/threonine protein kinase
MFDQDITIPIVSIKGTSIYQKLVFRKKWLPASLQKNVCVGTYTVYDEHNTHQTDVVVKLLPIPTVLPGYRNEIFILNAVQSVPGVVRLLNTTAWKSNFVCIQENCRSGDLFDYIMAGPIPLHEAQIIIQWVLETMQGIHHLGFVYGDLKPENIGILSFPIQSSKLRLLDFGSATVSTDHVFCLTGSEKYVPPSTIETAIDWDIWTIGLLLYILMFRQHPVSKKRIDFPSATSKLTMDLIIRLMDSVKPLPIAEALQHDWFRLNDCNPVTK